MLDANEEVRYLKFGEKFTRYMRFLVAEDTKHRTITLLLGKESGVILAGLLVDVDEDVLGCGGQTVLNTAKAAHRLLISTRVEEADIEGLLVVELGQEDGIGVGLAAVEVLAIAGEATEEDTLILLVPMVDGQQRIALVDTPDVGKGGHKRAVDHIPTLPIVLLLLVEHREERCTTLTHGKGAELGEDIGLFNAVKITVALMKMTPCFVILLHSCLK